MSDAKPGAVKRLLDRACEIHPEEVRATLERMRPTFPAGTEISVVADQSVQIENMVSELENNILSGLILVVLVLFAFLGLTNSIFVGIAIPFSMFISFIVLRGFGITLNMVVLFSLILGVLVILLGLFLLAWQVMPDRFSALFGDWLSWPMIIIGVGLFFIPGASFFTS